MFINTKILGHIDKQMFHPTRVCELLGEGGLQELFNGVKRYVKNKKIKYTERYPTYIKYLPKRYYVYHKYGIAAPRVYKIIYVSPDRVQYCQKPSFYTRLGKTKYGTYVIGGDWDKMNKDSQGIIPFEQYYFYKFVKYITKNYEKAGISDFPENISPENPEYHYNIILNLWEDIKKSGFKTQRELNEARNLFAPPEHDEITVNIDRNGEFIFDDGRHRFCIAKVLDIEKIPVRVFVRHKRWQRIRFEVLNTGPEALDKYPAINESHPDLQDVLALRI